MYNIKDALKSGTSKEQLLKDYEAALAEAQAELDAEKAAMAGLDEARLDAVCAALEYVVALGACKETDLTDELINFITDALKKEEKKKKKGKGGVKDMPTEYVILIGVGCAVVGIAFGFLIGFLIRKKIGEAKIGSAEAEAKKAQDKAAEEAAEKAEAET